MSDDKLYKFNDEIADTLYRPVSGRDTSSKGGIFGRLSPLIPFLGDIEIYRILRKEEDLDMFLSVLGLKYITYGTAAYALYELFDRII